MSLLVGGFSIATLIDIEGIFYNTSGAPIEAVLRVSEVGQSRRNLVNTCRLAKQLQLRKMRLHNGEQAVSNTSTGLLDDHQGPLLGYAYENHTGK